jgi:hypothetical protein
MTHKEKRIFFNWLQKHDALEKFRHNRFTFSLECKGSGWPRIANYIYMPLSEAIGLSFNWRHSPEGHEYWRNLDDIWMREYKAIFRNYDK